MQREFMDEITTRSMPRPRASIILALTAGLVLSGCAARVPIMAEGVTQPVVNDDTAVLWTFAEHRKTLFERRNFALVLRVDGLPIDRFTSLPKPVLLPAGKHRVLIRFDRESYLCGYFGCVNFEQVTRELTLPAEAGHHYLPLARKACGQDWIWIADAGTNAREALHTWQRLGVYPYDPVDWRTPNKDVLLLRVVAGESPPELCPAATDTAR